MVCTERKGGDDMTTMKRITVSFPEDLEKRIYQLRKKEKYVKCSYSELVRILVEAGMEAGIDERKKQKGA